MAQDETPAERLEPILRDLRRLARLHGDLLRSELGQSAAQSEPALVDLGAGAAMVVLGGVLGAMAAVHAVQRATRLPLWGCYGLVGGLLGAAGAGLMGSGARRLSGVSFIPRETIATLEDDLKWLSGKTIDG